MPLPTALLPLHATTGEGASAALLLEVALGVATVLAAVVYLRGLATLRRHPQGRRRAGRPWLLAAGVLVVVVFTATPLAELLEHRMWTHMTQHVVLIMVAGPLLAASAPGTALLAGLPPGV